MGTAGKAREVRRQERLADRRLRLLRAADIDIVEEPTTEYRGKDGTTRVDFAYAVYSGGGRHLIGRQQSGRSALKRAHQALRDRKPS